MWRRIKTISKAAEEKNAENLLVTDDLALAVKYAENWNYHRAHSSPYTGAAAKPVK